MKKFRNILAMLMVFVMLVAVMPMNVFAEGEGTGTPAPAEQKQPAEPTDPKQPGEPTDPKQPGETGETGTPATDEDKTAAKATVNALENISEEDKAAAIKAIDDAKTKEDINEAVAEAKTKDDEAKKAKEEEELKEAKTKAKATVNALENLTEEEKKGFTDKVDKASKIEEIQPIVEEAKTKAKEKADAKALEEAKTKAKDEINALENLTSEEKKSFTDRIDKASKIEEIQPIVEEAKTKAEAKKEHKITINKADNGTVTAKVGETENAEKAKEGEVVTLTIAPAKGYKLKEIKATNGNDEVALTKKSDTERTFKMPAADVTVTATFEEDKKPETKEYTISKAYTNHGSFTVDKTKANAGETITVNAKPDYGYAVESIYYIDNNNVKHIIKNYSYNDHYYYGYNGRYNDGYYGDYYRYYSDYENNYYYDYSSYDAYLKDRHYSFWNNGYRYWDDYDYKYYNKYYDRYYDDYYRYYDDYVDNYYRRYSSYEDYLYDKHYSHYRDYRYYDKYDYRYYNYTTSDTFEMPASNVTVYVEFTDWSYYGYYYDDYYYRYHRDKKDKEKEEKTEEEKKPAEEKTPQVFEASATINVGSNVFTKVNKNVTTTHQMDVAAYVKNGRVMLPLRYVAEALGLQVSWVPQTKTVIIWDLTQKVEIPIKSNKMIVNGVTYTSDVKPEIKNSRTMLPIANVARALGLIDGSDIIWDPVMKQVKLTRRVISK